MAARRRRPARRLDLEITFSAGTQTLPWEEKQGLLHWLRQQRRRPRRVFHKVTPSGEVRRL